MSGVPVNESGGKMRRVTSQTKSALAGEGALVEESLVGKIIIQHRN